MRFLAGERVVCTDTTVPYECAYRLTADDVGRTTLIAVATDSAGQTGAAVRTVTVNRFAPRSLSAKTTPRTDRRRPFRFTTRGVLRLPAGVTRKQACAGGDVAVQIKAARKTISTRRVALSRTCSYRSRVTFRSRSRFPKSGKLTVRVRFLGNAVLALAPREERDAAHAPIVSGHDDPLARARTWLEEAVAAGMPEPAGTALATASPDGVPSVRYVLLRGVDERGLRFFTNYGSRKGRELDANPVAALALWWPAMERQLRAEGPVERLTAEESDAYFASRARGSRLGAWASRQGSVIPGRDVLDDKLAELGEQYGDEVPRPEFWGGYLLRPTAIEFWEGRANRLHDRTHYLREGDGWRSERLSP